MLAVSSWSIALEVDSSCWNFISSSLAFASVPFSVLVYSSKRNTTMKRPFHIRLFRFHCLLRMRVASFFLFTTLSSCSSAFLYTFALFFLFFSLLSSAYPPFLCFTFSSAHLLPFSVTHYSLGYLLFFSISSLYPSLLILSQLFVNFTQYPDSYKHPILQVIFAIIHDRGSMHIK